MPLFGFSINESNKCVYFKFEREKGVIVCLYVDDILIFGMNLEEVSFPSSKFSMKDLEETIVMLDIKIIRNNDYIFLIQCHYIEKVLGRFKYHDCSPVATHFYPT